MAGTFTNLVYHVANRTKKREPIVLGSFRERLYQYMGGIVGSERGHLLSIGGTDDHVHLAMKLKPVDALSQTIGELKGNSSKWVNDKGLLNGYFSWQAGFGAFSVSESQLNTLQRYIATQVEHHQGQTFKEEFTGLRDIHNFPFDLKNNRA